MNTQTTPNKTATNGKPKRERKAQKSAKRLAAEAAVSVAKSDQEKTVAKSHLKIVTFEDLARQRTRRALKVLGHIENLANRASYTWTEEQAAKILGALGEKMKTLTAKFTGQKNTAADFDL